MPRLLFLFSLLNLMIGSGAFVMTGIVRLVADDLHLSLPAAGQAITAYALSTAVLAPLLLVGTGRWRRKPALLLALALFVLGNVVCATATGLPQLLAGRVVMGLGAAFTPLVAGIAVALVAPAQRGQALALVFLGMSLSYVVGVPLGAWVGFNHGWHTTIWAAAGVSAAGLLALAVWVPGQIDAPGVNFSGLGAVLRRADVLSVMAVTLAYFTAIFAVFSYIGPVLTTLVPMDSSLLSLTLMMFGLSGVAGTLIGGAAHDRFGPRRTIACLLAGLVGAMAVLPFTAGHYPAMLAAMLVWGTSGFGLMAPQQSRLAQMAPAQAPLLLSLNTSMLYLGTALGAVVGGAATAPVGLAHLPWAAAPFGLLAWLVFMFGPGRPLKQR